MGSGMKVKPSMVTLQGFGRVTLEWLPLKPSLEGRLEGCLEGGEEQGRRRHKGEALKGDPSRLPKGYPLLKGYPSEALKGDH